MKTSSVIAAAAAVTTGILLAVALSSSPAQADRVMVVTSASAKLKHVEFSPSTLVDGGPAVFIRVCGVASYADGGTLPPTCHEGAYGPDVPAAAPLLRALNGEALDFWKRREGL